MPGDVDEFGIPIKSDISIDENTDEFGIPIKKKESTSLPSQLESTSLNTESPLMDGVLAPSGRFDFSTGKNNIPIETPKQNIENKISDIQENSPDLLRAASTPATTTPKDQINYDQKIQNSLKGNQAEEALGRGVVHLANSVLKTPAFLYDLGAYAANKIIPGNIVPTSSEITKNMPEELDLTGDLDKAEAHSKEDFNKDYSKGISAYFSGDKPDYEKGFKALGLGVLENAPTTLALMFGNASGVTTAEGIFGGGAVFGADKYSEIKNDPNLSEEQKLSVAAGNGLAEGVGEQLFGLTQLGSMAKNIFIKDGAEAAAKAAKDGFIKTYGKMLARYIGVGAKEMSGEMGTQFAQNAIDKYSGVNPDLDLMYGVADAGLLGLGSSVSMAGPFAIMDVVKTAQAVKKAAKITSEQQALNDDIENPNVPDATKAVISKKVQDLNEESDHLASQEKEKFDSLTPEGQDKVNTLVDQSKKIADAANDENVSESTRDIITKDAHEVDDAIEKVYESHKKPNEDEIKAKEQDTKDINDEVDFLTSLKDEVGLDADQSNRLSELESKKTTSLVSSEATTENKSPVSETPEVVAVDQGSTLETPIDVKDIEKQIVDNKQKYWAADKSDKKAYVEYRIRNDELTKQLKDATIKVTNDGKKTEKTNQADETRVLNQAPTAQEEIPAAVVELSKKSENDIINKQEVSGNTEKENTETKTKKNKLVNDLVEEEVPDVKDSSEALKKLDDEIIAMKAADKKVQDTKFVGMLERAYKMKSEGKISRPAYTEFKNKVKDVYQGKKKIDAEEMKLRSTELIEKVKQKLLGQGYKNMVLSTGSPITPKTVSDLLDLTNSIIHKIIDAGSGAVTLAQATAKALNIVKKHPAYKKLVDNNELDESKFESELGKIKEEKPVKEKKQERKYGEGSKKQKNTEKKSFVNRTFNAENLSKEVKDKIESFGLNYSQFSNEEANEISKEIIKEHGIEGALNIARGAGEFPGSVRTLVYANIINEYRNLELKSTDKHNKQYNANRQGEVSDELDQFLRDSGRVISAIQKFYELSPAGIASKEVAGLRRENEKKRIQKGLTGKKDEILSALNATSVQENIEPVSKEKIKGIKTKRSQLLDELKKSFNEPTSGPMMKSSFPINDKQVVLIAKVAATYIEEGIVRIDALIKKIKSDVKKSTGIKISNDDIEKVMGQKINDQETLKERIEKVNKNTPLSEKEKLDILNKMLPKKRNQTAPERKSDHEKILSAYDHGAFDGTGRTYLNNDGKQTTETFEDLIYDKFGLVNVNKPEFKDKMSSLAADIHKTPKGSNLRNQEYQKMYDYISKYKAKGSLITDIWYANILSSYETHLRNLKYNITTTGVNQSVLLAEKALLKGDFNKFREIMSDGMKAFSEGFSEAREILKNGAVSRFDKPGVRGAIENSTNRFLALHKIPGRALRAADILFTVPLYEMKQRELMYDYVRSEAKSAGHILSKEETKQKVIEYLSRTPDRIATAKERAEKDVESVFGPEWKNNKKAKSSYNIRVSEIMEETRPEAVKEESIEWAKRALLTNEPRGFWGVIGKGLTTLASAKIPIPGSKLISKDGINVSGKIILPFINIMMNMTDRMIERTPIGFINAIRGKKGAGENEEILTKDERTELTLKAINYTVGVAALMAYIGASDDDDDVVITGKNTGDYSKDKTLQEGGKLDPYSVYIKGKKAFEYKDSPLSSLLAPVGYYRDYVKYGKNDGSINGMIKAGFDYMTFVVDQNAMKGLKDFFNAVSPEQYRELNAESIGKSLAASAQNLFIPNVVKAVNNDVRGYFGYNDKKVEDWHDAFFKDIPYVESLMLDNKYDHLGQPIKDQFKVPMVPYEKWQPVDPYYKFFTDHNFYPSYMKDKVAVVGNAPEDSQSFTEVELNKDQIRAMHQFRGDIIKEILDSKNDDGQTIMESMKDMDNSVFKVQMASIFSKAGKIAKTRLFNGNEVKSKIPSDSEIESKEASEEVKSMVKDIANSIDE